MKRWLSPSKGEHTPKRGPQREKSFPPNVSDALVSDRRVNNRVRNRAMAHERLKRPGVDSACRQGVASSVTQHVGVDPEGQSSSLAKPFNQLLGAVDRKCRLAFRQEHEVCMGVLAPKCPQ
jgi:hypothetical protein